MTRRLVVEADGGSRGNPGPAGYGALVTDAQTGEVLAELCDSLGVTTNNVAEYSGLVAGLRKAGELEPGGQVAVRMDSKLVVEQMSGRWQIKDPNLRKLAADARQAAGRLGEVSYTWIPRAQNGRADRLANQAMDAAAGRGGPRAGGTGREHRSAAERPSSGRSGEAEADPAPAAGRTWGPGGGTATTTLLLRHGETPLSAEHRFAGRGDVPLTEAGRRQASAAASALAARGGIDAVIASPLRRTLRTAEAVASAAGAPLITEDGLMEADFGKWEGLSFAEARAQFPGELDAWLADPAVAPPGGESFAEAGARVRGALARILAAHPGATLVLVSHVTPIKTLLCDALLAPPAAMFRLHLDVASLSRVDWYDDGPAVVRAVNDTAHLR